MFRFLLRRLILIPPILFLVNFLGYAYARTAQRIQLARNPFLAVTSTGEPLWPDYLNYLRGVMRFDFGLMPNSEETIPQAIVRMGGASIGLLAAAFLLSVLAGIWLGMLATRSEPPQSKGWLSVLSTFGQALPSFYAGSLLIVGSLFYALWRGPGTAPPLPLQGFGWDLHLVLPILALMARPTVQIAQVTSSLLASELDLLHIKVSRSVGHTWRTIRWKLAMRNILPPVTLTIAQSLRLLMAELILVEWLFTWPGLGRLVAATLVPSQTISSGGSALAASLFLNPPIIAALLTVLAFGFMMIDLSASLIIQVVDPRLRVNEGEK
jgi:peptide/nickel transport system permease protein